MRSILYVIAIDPGTITMIQGVGLSVRKPGSFHRQWGGGISEFILRSIGRIYYIYFYTKSRYCNIKLFLYVLEVRLK